MRILKRLPITHGIRPQAASLPRDILQEASRRLRLAAVVWCVLWSIALLMNNVVGPRLSPDQPLDDAWPWPGNPVAIGCILLSLGVIAHTRRTSAAPERVLNLALVYEILLAFAIGLVNQWTPNVHGLSWICALVLVHPLIVPNNPSKTLVASMIAASMDLVGLAITGARGVPLPEGPVLLWTYLPNYICAALAVLPSLIFLRLGLEVSTARELGSYQLGELLSRGGMGEVYRATHRMLARPAALKIIRPELLGLSSKDHSRLVQRFEREAKVTASLRSPHTINVYDYGIADDDTLYYVMELLEGFDLDSFIHRFGPVPWDRAVHWLRQICDSLAEAHQHHLIHRDIKPANILVCRYGRSMDFIKVLDFGFVKPTGFESGDPKLTAQAHIGGTPAYMAPEQALGDPPVDDRTDVYSLGCVAYWLLTGEQVFGGHSPMEVLTAHVKLPPRAPSTRTEMVIPEGLDRIVLQCLEKNPEQRPAGAELLDGLLAELETAGSWNPASAKRWWDSHAPGSADLLAP